MNLRSERVFDAQPSLVVITEVGSETKESEIVEEEPNKVSKNKTHPRPLINQEHRVEPPYLERLTFSKQIPQSEFELLQELQNFHVKIPLLETMRDVSIYANTLREYCDKKPKKKSRDPLAIHVMGKLSDFMMGKAMPMKYGDLRNPILAMQINEVEIPNVLVDLGTTINFITTETMHALVLQNLKHAPTGSVSVCLDRVLS